MSLSMLAFLGQSAACEDKGCFNTVDYILKVTSRNNLSADSCIHAASSGIPTSWTICGCSGRVCAGIILDVYS